MKWLFLVHQLKAPNSRARVKVWRLTKKVGTILYRNSVYVLPYSGERLEDFRWLSQQIRDSGGEASVFVSEGGDTTEDRNLKRMFLSAREMEYGELKKKVHQFDIRCTQIRQAPSITTAQMAALEKGLRQLEERYQEIHGIDFFSHPWARPIGTQLRDLRLSIVESHPRKESSQKIVHHARSEFRGKTWVTREHIHIDRLCSAWLIKRFIDPNARFIFAPEENIPTHAIPFDVFGAEFTHKGDRCTFETLLESFRFKEKALFSLAELVHEIDLKDEKYNRPESAGLDMVVRGISDSLRDDPQTLDLGFHILDALYLKFSKEGNR